MNNWKSINITRQYGNERIAWLSMITILISFIMIYTAFKVIFSKSPLHDDQILLFFVAILLLYPVHKLLHFLPLILQYKKIKIFFPYKWNVMPVIHIKIHDPIPKQLFVFSLLIPFFIVSLLLAAGALIYPQYAHYFTILLSFHLGLCVHDFIVIKNLFGSPTRSFVEEHEAGYNILVMKEL
jgi:hypothetical protein